MRWVAVALVLLIGGCLWLTPLMSRRTVPLGVSVPSDKVDHPVVRRAILRFRQGVGVATVLVAIVMALLGDSESALSLAPLVVIALAVGVYVWARRPILEAKAADGWYDQVPVRLRATVTEPTERAPWTSRVEIGWYAGSFVLLLGTAIVGAARYGDLPARIPTHFDFSGTPDQFSAKSVLSVFGPLVIGVVLIVVFLGLIGITHLTPERQFPDGDPARAAERARRVRQFVARVLGVMALVVCAMICGACLAIYCQATSWALTPVLVGGLVLIGAVLVWAVAGTIRLRQPTAAAASQSAAESPDDDRFWKAGLVYVNPGDPALFVPKRQGLGYTINLGHRAGQVVAAVLLLMIVVSIVTAVI